MNRVFCTRGRGCVMGFSAGMRELTLWLCLLACTSRPAFATWATNGVAISPSLASQSGPNMIALEDGSVIIVWSDARNDAGDIYAQHVTVDGAIAPFWPADGLAVCAAPGEQSSPVIVMTMDGYNFVAWQDRRSGADYDIYAQYFHDFGWIPPGYPANGLAVCGAVGDQVAPAIVNSGGPTPDDVAIAWTDRRNGIDNDIYVQIIDPVGVIHGPPVNGILECGAAGDQYLRGIVKDGNWLNYVVWDDHRNGLNWDIYAQSLAGGIPQWPVNGLGICTAPDFQDDASITATSDGAIIAWSDRRNGSDYDVYAQRVDLNGILWAANGNRVSSMAGHDLNPVVASDGAGGANVAWLNENILLYGARVSWQGWVGPATALSSRFTFKLPLCAAPDGEGGAFFAWQDDPGSSDVNIYLQRISGSGLLTAVAPGWPSDGLGICTAIRGQRNPTIASVGNRGAIVAWEDQRSETFTSNVYALRTGLGAWVPTSSDPRDTDAATFTSAWPNPFINQVRFSFAIPAAQPIVAEIYDVAGRRTKALIHTLLPAGAHSLTWNGRGEDGLRSPAGTYFLRLRWPGHQETCKILRVD